MTEQLDYAELVKHQIECCLMSVNKTQFIDNVRKLKLILGTDLTQEKL